ncbi:MAG: phosphatase PAP2 family protein [Mycoplasmataceae bacterium]|nr:phosphatase PAP2 family protein [Mycoplasmataceae bacterium]
MKKTQFYFNKFNWNKKWWWKIVLQIFILTLIVLGLETIAYFYVGVWFGNLFTDYLGNGALNLQLPFDKIIPWFTPLFPFYIIWPFISFIVLPLCIYFSGGKRNFYAYTVVSILFYIISCIIYSVIPTTCSPAQFQPDGSIYKAGFHSWDWTVNQPFHSELIALANDPNNIYGSAPSFHNYWAAMFIFFAIGKHIKLYWKGPMIACGLLISISTLMLHQHNLADIAITYATACLILMWEIHANISTKFEQAWDKWFKIKNNNAKLH